LAKAESTAVGSSGQAHSTATTSFAYVTAESSATGQAGSTATTNAIAQGGGSGQNFANPGQTAYAFSVGLPSEAYAATLIGGATNVADALLGPRDVVFGTAILGGNYASDGNGESRTYDASATFDFSYRGELWLGLIDDQSTGFPDDGLGFQSMEFFVDADGKRIFDTTFMSLPIAESYFRDVVLDLGAYSFPTLTFGYELIANGSGGFGFDLALGGAIPEPSTGAMIAVGFAWLGFAGCRASRRG
jgi:hypothetical protein